MPEHSPPQVHRGCLLFGNYAVKSGVGAKHFRNDDAAVRLLIVFHDTDDHTIRCGGRADGVDIVTFRTIFVTDVEAAALEAGQVGVAGNFAVSAEAGEVGFDVILLVSGGTEIADTDVDDMVRQTESLEESFFVFQTELMILDGVFRFAEDDLFNLVELVDAEDTPGSLGVVAQASSESSEQPVM